MKKAFCVLASAILLCAAAAFSAFAEETVTEEVTGMPSYYVECGIAPIEKGRDYGSSPIRAFSASEDGRVAICFGEDGKGTILVLDGQAQVICGYDVTLSGEVIPRWTEKGLTLYLASSRIAVVLGEKGEFIEKLRYSDTPDGEAAVKALFYDGAQETVLSDGTVYRLADGSLAPNGGETYNRLIRIDGNGEETVLYEAAVKPTRGRIFAYIGGCVAVLGAVGVAVAEICVRAGSRAEAESEKQNKED